MNKKNVSSLKARKAQWKKRNNCKPTTKKQQTKKTPEVHILALLCEALIKNKPSLGACSEVKHVHTHRIPMSQSQIQ